MYSHPAGQRPLGELETLLQGACLGLCAISSVTGNERQLADACWQWAQDLGLWPANEMSRHGNAMVLGQPDARTGGDRPTVALVGHLDTVPPAGGTFQLPEIRNGQVVGLGASDMKGGIAVMQVLCRQLVGQPLPIKPIVVLYDREEGPFAENGLEPLLAQHPELAEVDLAVVMEPTGNALQLGCLGGLQATVRFVGQAAHSARPWEGSNAVHQAGPFLSHLLKREYKEVEVQGLTFREAMSVTLASGGRARNVIPNQFDLNVNYRVAPTDGALETAKAELVRVASGAEVTFTDISPPGPVPRGNPILSHWQGLCSFRVEPKQAWTDVARLAGYGIDAVNFGPGLGAQAHQAGEYVEISAMVEAHEMLSKLLTTPLVA